MISQNSPLPSIHFLLDFRDYKEFQVKAKCPTLGKSLVFTLHTDANHHTFMGNKLNNRYRMNLLLITRLFFVSKTIPLSLFLPSPLFVSPSSCINVILMPSGPTVRSMNEFMPLDSSTLIKVDIEVIRNDLAVTWYFDEEKTFSIWSQVSEAVLEVRLSCLKYIAPRYSYSKIKLV